jgi:hypothetical protein
MGSFCRRLLALFRRSRLERDLDDELTFHLVEPGLNQLEAQVYAIFEGEKLPRVLWSSS